MSSAKKSFSPNVQTGTQMLVSAIVADIYEIAGRFRDHGETIARTVGQTQTRWQVLSAASGRPHTVPQIARVLGVTRQNVQRVADLLVAEGAAEYRDNPDHRGSPHLILTGRGHAALEAITRAAAGYHAQLARKLSRSDVAALKRCLRRLLSALVDVEPVNPN
jgi:DNA-binding MarR family transcriptional regulator